MYLWQSKLNWRGKIIFGDWDETKYKSEYQTSWTQLTLLTQNDLPVTQSGNIIVTSKNVSGP